MVTNKKKAERSSSPSKISKLIFWATTYQRRVHMESSGEKKEMEWVTCSDCNGSGFGSPPEGVNLAKVDPKILFCSTCGGRGQVLKNPNKSK